LNNRPFAKLAGTRWTLFAQLDRPAMRPLPAARYEFATWTAPKVNIDYHCDVGRHYYSVPYQLVGHRLDARLTEHAVEFFFKGRRVASRFGVGVVARPEHGDEQLGLPDRAIGRVDRDRRPGVVAEQLFPARW
jgi:hypothetical protein